MKKSFVLCLILLLLITAGFTQNGFEKLSKDAVSQSDLRIAISLAEKILLGQKSGNIYLLSGDEAIPPVAKGLTREVQLSSYESVRAQFGDYESMNFMEAWTMNSEQGVYTIYRFKGDFTDTKEQPEIRVVFDGESKLAGFWIRPWEDDLQGKP